MQNPTTSTALALREQPQVALAPGGTLRPPLAFTDDERRIIRDSFMPGATEAEARALIAIAEHMRLDPFKRQIHFVKRWQRGEDGAPGREAWAFQTAIDGFRSMAEDTGEFLGSEEPEFIFEETVNPATGEPTGRKELVARVKVHRKGFERPFVGVARYNEFVQTKKDGSPNSMWARAPRNMLAKCAEAQAFRKAFPQSLAGVYTEDELAERDVTPQVAPVDVKPITTGPARPALVDADLVKHIDWPAAFRAAATEDELAVALASYQKVKEGLSKDLRTASQAAYKARKAELEAAARAQEQAAPGEQVDPSTGEVVPPPAGEEREPGAEG